MRAGRHGFWLLRQPRWAAVLAVQAGLPRVVGPQMRRVCQRRPQRNDLCESIASLACCSICSLALPCGSVAMLATFALAAFFSRVRVIDVQAFLTLFLLLLMAAVFAWVIRQDRHLLSRARSVTTSPSRMLCPAVAVVQHARSVQLGPLHGRDGAAARGARAPAGH